ncbi:MAG: GTP pyrophosphokinase family protein [Bacilli bacterium]|nr:GTP pyrophosphokinase family protein [Bacilli bacterium]
MYNQEELFNWVKFLQTYELAVEGFVLKIEGIRKQYLIRGIHCPIEIVSGRVKTPESILNKAERMEVPFNEIASKVHDIGGVRITCKYIEDVYKVAELLKARKDIKLVEERDYIKNVKPSGYRSLHLIFKYNVETIEGQTPILLEFQIRTHAMHFWASIEHSIKYKYNKKVPGSIKERLYNASMAAAQVDKEMSAIHQEMLKIDENCDTEIIHGDPMENEVFLKKY